MANAWQTRQSPAGSSPDARIGAIRHFKPDNVIIDAAGRVRVLDFGLAEGDARDTARASAGTRGYVAPEQLAGHGDARADQYSFCVTLHELLHDRRPDQPGPQRKIPRWLAQAVARGLHSEPHARWSALAPLLAELEQAPRRQRNTWRRLGLAGLLGLQLAATGAVQHLRAASCPAQRITAAATVRAASVDEASAPTCTRRAAHPRELLSHNWEPACITAPT